MIEYMSVEDVDDFLGPGWADNKQKEQAVMVANVWLTNKRLPHVDIVPKEWIIAGSEIAKEAVAGKIFRAAETGVLSKSVKADTVASSKTFASNHKVISAGESLALALLDPWLRQDGNVFMLKRI